MYETDFFLTNPRDPLEAAHRGCSDGQLLRLLEEAQLDRLLIQDLPAGELPLAANYCYTLLSVMFYESDPLL